MQRQQEPLTTEKINEILQQMKKQSSQVQGERMNMESEVTTAMFQNFANMVGQVYGRMEIAENQLAEVNKRLEEIYQGHPDIKISYDKQEKEKQAPKVKGK